MHTRPNMVWESFKFMLSQAPNPRYTNNNIHNIHDPSNRTNKIPRTQLFALSSQFLFYRRMPSARGKTNAPRSANGTRLELCKYTSKSVEQLWADLEAAVWAGSWVRVKGAVWFGLVWRTHIIATNRRRLGSAERVHTKPEPTSACSMFRKVRKIRFYRWRWAGIWLCLSKHRKYTKSKWNGNEDGRSEVLFDRYPAADFCMHERPYETHPMPTYRSIVAYCI